MADDRIARLTKKWCEEYWKGRYFLIGKWDGKEAKNLEKLLSYAQSNFGAMEAEFKVEEAMRNYLRTDDTYLGEKKHPFSILYQNRDRYFVANRVERKAEERKEEKPHVEISDVELLDRIIGGDPVKYARGWMRYTRQLMKRLNPKEYERHKRVLMELVGKERMKKIYEEEEQNRLETESLQKTA